jgi:hypothetical protein
LRCIEELLPVLYPEVQLSYGAVQAMSAAAELRAAVVNEGADLSAIDAGALDEMFSQGEPVLAGVDLDSGYLFGLALRQGRSGSDWTEVLESAKKQGLDLKVAVKDAAKGIAVGVKEVFPNAEQRDDCFHAHYEMNKVRLLLERRAYKAIQGEFDANQKLDEARWCVDGERAKLAQKLRWARAKADKAIALHDAFERAMRATQEAMEFVSLETGRVRTQQQMQQELEAAATEMLGLDDGHCRKVGRYLLNRAPGLALHMGALNTLMAQLTAQHGPEAVEAACFAYRMATDLRNGRRPWDIRRHKRLLCEAIADLERHAPEHANRLFERIDIIVQKRHRASSAIEGFNAALRPFLYIHKGATQGFLELFRARHNLKIRRWGRHKGTSAHELLTGERIEDWLTALGYPPSQR